MAHDELEDVTQETRVMLARYLELKFVLGHVVKSKLRCFDEDVALMLYPPWANTMPHLTNFCELQFEHDQHEVYTAAELMELTKEVVLNRMMKVEKDRCESVEKKKRDLGALGKLMEAGSSSARETQVRLEKKRKTDILCAEVESSTGQGRAAGGAASGSRNVQDEIRARCVLELNLYLSAAHDMTVQDVPPDGDSIASWWAARRQTAPKLPNLVEVFKNVFGKTMSSAVLENDFKKTAKVMPTDRNQLADPYYAAQCMSACNWELVRALPKHEIQDLGSIEKVNQAMPSASFGVDTYAQSDVDMRDAANILTSLLRCPMVDCDPDDERDAEEEEEEQGGGAEDSEDE